jgi:hypothetical protein
MKGIAFSIEAIIAAVVLLLAIAVIFSSPPDSKILSTKHNAYVIISELDNSGELRRLIASENLTELENKLKPWISNFELEICTSNCTGPGRLKTTIVNWIVSGMLSFDPKQLRIYIYE